MMNSSAEIGEEQAIVERLKAARRSSAVLKAKLIALRCDMPKTLVFAFEGDDDKIVYGQWLRRIKPDLPYEPFPCGGKKEVMGLRNSLHLDLSGLERGVYFFVDRDFNDLAGFLSTERVFMTETYSVENQLVAADILDYLLRDEFPCHSRPDIRTRIVEMFAADYAAFLEATRMINQRLYIARQKPVELSKRLPTSLRDLAVIELGNVRAVTTPAEEVVVYKSEPSAEEVLRHSHEFARLTPDLRYRGKFSMAFFIKWLTKLAEECASGRLGLFDRASSEGSVRRAEFVLSNFASKSRLPDGLRTFVATINSSV